MILRVQTTIGGDPGTLIDGPYGWIIVGRDFGERLMGMDRVRSFWHVEERHPRKGEVGIFIPHSCNKNDPVCVSFVYEVDEGAWLKSLAEN